MTRTADQPEMVSCFCLLCDTPHKMPREQVNAFGREADCPACLEKQHAAFMASTGKRLGWTGAEKLIETRYSDGEQRLYIGRIGTAWRHFHQWKRETPKAVGPYYPTKAALLLDHDRYATDYGF